MAEKSARRSLAGRAGAAARKVVDRPVKESALASAPAKKAAAVKSTTAAKKAAAKKPGPTKKSAAVKRTAPRKVAAVKRAAPAKKTAAARKVVPVKKAAPANRSVASRLVVLANEDPWTKEELGEVRSQLHADVKRLRAELEEGEDDLTALMRDAGEGAGNDQADVGSATFERDQEMTIVNNAREMLSQSERALGRIADRSYGACESCGQPIGKNRLMAFPRATLCMTCKQREERR